MTCPSSTHLFDDQSPKTVTDKNNGPQLGIFILFGVEQGNQQILGVLVNPGLARSALEGVVVIEGQDSNVLDMFRQELLWPERPVSSSPCLLRMSSKTSNQHDANYHGYAHQNPQLLKVFIPLGRDTRTLPAILGVPPTPCLQGSSRVVPSTCQIHPR